MTNVTITNTWYNELKGLIKMENAYFYQGFMGTMVEVDVEETEFESVSKRLVWMD